MSASSSIISISSLFIVLPFGDGFKSISIVSSILMGDFDFNFSSFTGDLELLLDLGENLSTITNFFFFFNVFFSAFFSVPFFKLCFDLLFDLDLDVEDLEEIDN